MRCQQNHRRFCTQGLNPTGERLVRHVVLHNVDQRFVRALFLAGELIEGSQDVLQAQDCAEQGDEFLLRGFPDNGCPEGGRQ